MCTPKLLYVKECAYKKDMCVYKTSSCCCYIGSVMLLNLYKKDIIHMYVLNNIRFPVNILCRHTFA